MSTWDDKPKPGIMKYVIWNIEWQGYRPNSLEPWWSDRFVRHGGIFNAKRFSTRREAEAARYTAKDVVEEVRS